MTDFRSGDVVMHPAFGFGTVTSAGLGSYMVDFVNAGLKEISRSFEDLRKVGTDGPVTLREVASVLKMLLTEEGLPNPADEIGDRWKGGMVVLKPGKEGIKPAEIPIEKLFAKVTLVRERLRVLEQKLNNCDKLDDFEKADFQQYITRCYGSLTSFNFLFRYRESWFVGEGKDRG